MKSFSAIAAFALLPFSSLSGQSAETVRLTDKTDIVFATIEAGQEALQTPDRYTEALSRFDLESRLKTNDKVTANDLMQLAAKQVVAWGDADRKKMTTIITSIAARFAKFHVPLPRNILLIQTTGKEEGDAAYCRRNAVVFPQRYVRFPDSQLERIFIHELFHILSSHNQPLQESLYEIIGFKPCPEIALPDSLADLKITNPDGPTLSHYIELDVDGEQQMAVLLLYSPERFDPKQSRSFFAYLKIRLLVVQREGDRWSVVEEANGPVLLNPKRTPSFHRQIGRNTKYIMHPDEIMADNFVHMIMQKSGLPNQEIVTQMAMLFKRSSD
jgi:hypothetical protein